jgi:hypothetical protein
MVAELPAELIQRRRSYWRLALELLQTPPLRYQEHLLLMKNALEKFQTPNTFQSQAVDPPAEVAPLAVERIET